MTGNEWVACLESCDHGLRCERSDLTPHTEHHRWEPVEDRLHEWADTGRCVPTAVEGGPPE